MSDTPSPSASNPGAKPQTERRRWERHPCGPETICHLILNDSIDFWAVEVHNLSEGGANLVLDRMVPTEKLIAVEFQNPEKGFSCERQLRVIYGFKDPNGDFYLGGAFSQKLTREEMKGLI